MKNKKIVSILLAVALIASLVFGAVAESNAIPMVTPEPDDLLENPYEDELDASMPEAEPEADWMSGQQAAPDDEMYTIDDFAVTEGLPDNWLNILLLGSDVKYTNKYGRTDSMIVLSLNLATKEAKLTSFMRDIWVSVNGHQQSVKLNAACFMGGPQLTMRTINEYFGLNLQYYALVNLSSMAEVIDLIGGLDLDVTEKEKDALNKGLFDLSPLSGMDKLETYGKGVHLNGNQATAFARIRKIDSDYKRTQRQRYVLTQIAKRLQNENAGTIVGVIMKLLGCVETNMNITQLMTIAAAGMQMDMDSIRQFRIPADNTFKSGTFDGVWCIKPDFNANRQLLQQFIYGG
ncbi:MAG: LCP family protein [Clostridia bacterium]|nr:LCP family protein [Clostridia bacterium]